MIRFISIVAFFLLLNACAVQAPKQKDLLFQSSIKSSAKSSVNCLDFYTELDDLIANDNVSDVQASLISGYPYLSVNRFLVSFKSELDSPEKLDYWLSLLAELNIEAREIEWLNLSQPSRQQISDKYLSNSSFKQIASNCSRLLLADLSVEHKQQVITAATVKESYSTVQRFFGFYSLTSLFVSRQISKHQSQSLSLFAEDLEKIPLKGRLTRYGLASINRLKTPDYDFNNPLKIPKLEQQALDALFIQHAPILEVDEQDKNDLVGRIILNEKSRADFLADKASFYVLPSYTRFNGEVLLQLNYIFWFASRPQKSAFDIYSGKLDGLIWQVTLDKNGEPLLYDSVHNCGCYHKYFLSDKLEFKRNVAEQEREPPFVAQQFSDLTAEKRIVLRIGSVAHFVNRVYQQKTVGELKNIEIKSYADLRSLVNSNKRRSMFASDGLVDGTERAERWLLWPMGVPSAGAMRQWGHHAVAFVGKRYFDDPGLLDKYFLRK